MKTLIVEDTASMRHLLERILRSRGHEVTACGDAETAWEIYQQKTYPLILLDWLLPGMDGLQLCKQIRTLPDGEDSLILVITQRNKPEDLQAVLAAGADNYLAKPVGAGLLNVRLAIAEQRVRNRIERKRVEAMKAEVIQLRAVLEKEYVFDNIIGKSQKMQGIYALIQQATESNVTILIQGESGTGKELVAKAIHFNSLQTTKPFVVVNCAAIPETLIESELFGHERGAFTGATTRRIGKFEQAHRGTIFLDEIGEMQTSLQVKLLRVLQEREIQRVGGTNNIPIDLRVIAATNKDLEAAVKAGNFREDLFYRIAVFPIVIPPLRERRGDISLLAEHFLKRHAETTGKSITGISAEALQILMDYGWPGNVRELENIIQRAALLEPSDVLQARNTALREIGSAHEQLHVPGALGDTAVATKILPLEAVEKQAIAHAMKVKGNNITHAAQALGIDRTTLHRKLKNYDLLEKK